MPALLTPTGNGRLAVPFGSGSVHAPDRSAEALAPPCYLIIVRRNERDVFDYLSMRMRGIESVEVKLDQRQSAGEPRADDRRGRRRSFNAFGVQIARRQPTRGDEPIATL